MLVKVPAYHFKGLCFFFFFLFSFNNPHRSPFICTAHFCFLLTPPSSARLYPGRRKQAFPQGGALGWWEGLGCFWGSSVSNIKYFYDLVAACAQLLTCVRLCGPMDYSLPASSDRGTLQARKPGWAVISFSRGSPTRGPNPGLLHLCAGRQTPYHCTTPAPTSRQAVP